MRYRLLSATGDYIFGHPGAFLSNSPAAVAQAITTRLNLRTGEWLLDATEGTDYSGGVLGYGTQGTRDQIIRARILETPGVNSLIAYSSTVDSSRKMSVSAQVDTIYGAATISAEF